MTCLSDGRHRVVVLPIVSTWVPNWFWSQTFLAFGVGEIGKHSRCRRGLVMLVTDLPMTFFVGRQSSFGMSPTLARTALGTNSSFSWTNAGTFGYPLAPGASLTG